MSVIIFYQTQDVVLAQAIPIGVKNINESNIVFLLLLNRKVFLVFAKRTLIVFILQNTETN